MQLGRVVSTAVAGLMLSTSLSLAGPEIVSSPGADPACFAPRDADTKYMQRPAKAGPYKVAVANGFVGNGRASPAGRHGGLQQPAL